VLWTIDIGRSGGSVSYNDTESDFGFNLVLNGVSTGYFDSDVPNPPCIFTGDCQFTGVWVEVFAGTPGQANCFGQSVSALAQQYGGFSTAAKKKFSSVQTLQGNISVYCDTLPERMDPTLVADPPAAQNDPIPSRPQSHCSGLGSPGSSPQCDDAGSRIIIQAHKPKLDGVTLVAAPGGPMPSPAQ
jgi:hypothetical protein